MAIAHWDTHAAHAGARRGAHQLPTHTRTLPVPSCCGASARGGSGEIRENSEAATPRINLADLIHLKMANLLVSELVVWHRALLRKKN